MSEIRLEIFGEPVAQGRPRAFKKGNMIGMYDPKKSSTWKDSIKIQAINQKATMLSGAISMHASFYLTRPKSLSKKVKHHIKKPDVDNLLKSLKDALKSICYHDDSQIVRVIVEKEYSTYKPGVLVLLKQIEN